MALGNYVMALGKYVMPLGNCAIVLGNYVMPLGNYVMPLGNCVIALGNHVMPLGNYAILLGNQVIASGDTTLPRAATAPAGWGGRPGGCTASACRSRGDPSGSHAPAPSPRPLPTLPRCPHAVPSRGAEHPPAGEADGFQSVGVRGGWHGEAILR